MHSGGRPVTTPGEPACVRIPQHMWHTRDTRFFHGRPASRRLCAAHEPLLPAPAQAPPAAAPDGTVGDRLPHDTGGVTARETVPLEPGERRPRISQFPLEQETHWSAAQGRDEGGRACGRGRFRTQLLPESAIRREGTATGDVADEGFPRAGPAKEARPPSAPVEPAHTAHALT